MLEFVFFQEEVAHFLVSVGVVFLSFFIGWAHYVRSHGVAYIEEIGDFFPCGPPFEEAVEKILKLLFAGQLSSP